MGKRRCLEPGCSRLTTGTRCERHRKAKRRREDRRRPGARARGYDDDWAVTRSRFLAAFPICQWPEGCIRPSTEAHHVDGLGPTGPRGHDWGNLMALCHEHHSKITAAEQPGGFR